MSDRLKQFWHLGTGPAYHKVEAHSRDASLDVSAEDLRLRRTIRVLRRWLLLLSVLLTATLLALGANIALQNGNVVKRKSPVPKLPTRTVTFQRDDLYAGPSTTDSDKAWDNLMPSGEGFILVDQPDQYGLPPGLSSKTEEGKVYDIAAFHSIHCLTSIRQYLWHLKFAVDRNATDQMKLILLDPQEDHILSCFDYLRQSMMCSADTTLEWPQADADGRRTTVDGWGVTHQCIDWDALVRFTKDNVPQ